jgi:hypothetical protein
LFLSPVIKPVLQPDLSVSASPLAAFISDFSQAAQYLKIGMSAFNLVWEDQS